MISRRLIMRGRLYPALRDAEFPTGDKARGFECRVELGVTLGQARTAKLCEQTIAVLALCEKAKAFENSAVAKAIAIGEQLVIITLRMREIEG